MYVALQLKGKKLHRKNLKKTVQPRSNYSHGSKHGLLNISKMPVPCCLPITWFLRGCGGIWEVSWCSTQSHWRRLSAWHRTIWQYGMGRKNIPSPLFSFSFRFLDVSLPLGHGEGVFSLKSLYHEYFCLPLPSSPVFASPSRQIDSFTPLIISQVIIRPSSTKVCCNVGNWVQNKGCKLHKLLK